MSPWRATIERTNRLDDALFFMRIIPVFCLAVLSAGVAEAQNTRDFVLHLHRKGDTASVRGAVVTVDHTIEAGNTDAAGNVTVPDLDDGGHIVEVVAHGYQTFEDN